MADPDTVHTLPLLPLKNSVLFPHLLMPLAAGRPGSVAAVEAALATEEKEIALVAQRDSSVEAPSGSDLYTVGTKAAVKKMSRGEGGMIRLIVLGLERVSVVRVETEGDHLRAQTVPHPLPEGDGPEIEALHRAVVELASRALQLTQPEPPEEITRLLATTEDPVRLVYLMASMLNLDVDKEQALLEASTRADALRLMHTYLSYEVQVLELRTQIASQAQAEMSKQQREYVLRQQLRAIQNELGEGDPQKAEATVLRDRIGKLALPPEVRTEVERELGRLETLPPAAPDYQVTRTWLDLVAELPWEATTEDQLDLPRARQILDEDHYDLKDVKERIVEHLGVLKLNPDAKAPILCFFGPPGVGKTSLGQSIARALGRKFERLSLGGLHDEAELRGHRRTYIGAMPGRVLQAIRRSGTRNPVLMLDEVDKLGRDFRGDPAAALLEILDPEQNKTFRDNYLDLPFDLSRVLFITTANALDTVPGPLLDRMESLRLPGYTEEEKTQIAERFLLPRQLRQTGLKPDQCTFEPETIRGLITGYTREAGVRQLERAIGRVLRKIAIRFAEGDFTPVTVRPDALGDLLGPEMFLQEEARKEQPPGVATGLAWTESGGEVLYVEASLLPGARELVLTGHLGEVMRESARAAQTWVWSHAEELGIDTGIFRRTGVHIHVPAGSIPKDGPSAGVTMATALASLYTRIPARSDAAMTGEITLTGLVLPIGGIKEKILAARRAGIREVILPRANERDLRELTDEVRKEMRFVFASRIMEVLAAAIPGIEERAAVHVSHDGETIGVTGRGSAAARPKDAAA